MTKYIFVIPFTLILIGCSSNHQDGFRAWERSYHNEVYGNINHKYLKADKRIYSYPCAKGKVGFYENDSLISFRSFEDFEINGNVIPKKSRITMYYNGQPEFIYLDRNTNIDGWNVSSAKRSLHWHVSFYNDGSLSTFRSTENLEIDGIPCSKDHEIVLYPDGHLLHGILSEDFPFNGKTFNSGNHVILDSAGIMMRFSIDKFKKINRDNDLNRLRVRRYPEIQ